MLRSNAMLGLAISPGVISVAQVVGAPTEGRVTTAGSFKVPSEIVDNPVAVGKALRVFLKERGFTADRCVIGLGSDAVLARSRVLPPCPDDAVHGAVSLAVEREFTGSDALYVCDYMPPEALAQGMSVLILAALKTKVDLALAVARSAGVKVQAVTCCPLVISACTSGCPAHALLLGRDAQLVTQQADAPMMLKRLGQSSDQALTANLERALTMLQVSQDNPPHLHVWDEAGNADIQERLQRNKHVRATFCGYPQDLGVRLAEGCAADVTAVGATALAMLGLWKHVAAVDFLHSRLAEQPDKRIGRKTIIASAVAGIFILLGAWFAWDWHAASSHAAQLEAELATLTPQALQTQQAIDAATFARDWFDRRPEILECFKEITAVLPERDLWITSLDIRDGQNVRLTGKCASEGMALELLDALKASSAFDDIRSEGISQASTLSREVSFTVRFRFAGGH